MNRSGSRQRKDHPSKDSYWHRAAVLMGWQRKRLNGELVYIRINARTDVPNSYDIAGDVELACIKSGLFDLDDVKKFLRKFSN